MKVIKNDVILQYNNTGSVNYSITFEYDTPEQVKVRTYNSTTNEYVDVTDWEFDGATAIRFTGVVPDTFEIIRVTDISQSYGESRYAVFQQGSAIKAGDLNGNLELLRQAIEGNANEVDSHQDQINDLNDALDQEIIDRGQGDQNLQDQIDEIEGGSLDGRYLNVTGDTMTGPLSMSNNRIQTLADPSSSTDAVNLRTLQQYVDIEIGDVDSNGPHYARHTFTAVGGETLVTVPEYATGGELVFINGSEQTRNVDYTATNATTITFAQPLLTGDVFDLYCINTLKVVEVPIGDTSNLPVIRQTFTATAGQTTFTLTGGQQYTPGKEQIYLNGGLLERDTDYTGNVGTSFVLDQGASVGDQVEIFCTNYTVDGGANTANNVSYAYPGGTEQTVQSRLEQYVSVKDFGAVGDGITDDTAAIQATIDANPGKEIRIPSGTYLINTTISVAVSGTSAACVRLVGDGSTQTIINNQTGGAAFNFNSGNGAVFAYDAAFENLQITSVGSQAGTIGIELNGCRFARINNVRIDNMASHGIHGNSTLGDFTDTAQILVEQTEIESCGGYGIYAQCNTSGIQYNWNLNQVRVGSCTLGGVLYESMVNARIENCGFFYNNEFGLKITKPVGGNISKIITIANTEFDTNDGVQIDLDAATSIRLEQIYLVANNNLPQTFAKGIVVGADSSNITTSHLNPRIDPMITGITVLEVEAGATDVIARDTNYSGYSVANGNMYVDNTATLQLCIEDVSNRNKAYKGTYTVAVGNLSDATVSATTVTGHYAVAGNTVTASFRNLNNIDLTGFPGSSIISLTLPKTCLLADVGFIGNVLVTSDSGSANPPYPVTTNGSTKAYMQRAGTAAFLTKSDLTSGTSDISFFTLTYIWG